MMAAAQTVGGDRFSHERLAPGTAIPLNAIKIALGQIDDVGRSGARLLMELL
jgi:hypothetical protein